ACGNKVEREAHYMGLAKTHMEKNQYAQAFSELKNVLQINGTNYEAYYYLGLIYESRQQYRSAIENYTRALEQNPDFVPAKTHLARMHLMPGQGPKAVDKATAILKSSPTDLSVKTIMAEVTARTGNLGKAIGDLESARKKGPESLDLSQELASLYLRQGNLPQLERLLVESIKRYPRSTALHAYLAQAYMLGDNPVRAEGPLQAVIALEPDDFSHQAKLVSYYVLLGQLQKAETILRDSVVQATNDVRRVLALKEFLLRYSSPESAEAELLGFIQASPKLSDLRFALAGFYEETGRKEKAEGVYQDIITQNFSAAENEKAHNRLARIYIGMGKASAAKNHAAEALIISRDNTDALVSRGKIALEAGDLERAIADFRSALKHQPGSLEYIGLLSRAHMQNKQPGLARELLFQAAKNDQDNLPIRTMLVESLVQMREYKTAMEEVNDQIKAFPFDSAPRRLRDDILVAQKTLPGSDAGRINVESAMPPAAVSIYRQANQYFVQKKYDEAIGEFQKALRLAPAAIEPLNGLVEAYLAQGRPDMALSRVKAQLRINSPTLHQTYYLLGQLHAGQNHHADAVNAYSRALDINASWEAPYLALAHFYHGHGDNKKALSILERAASNLPRSQIVALHLASMLEANQSYGRAITTYENLLQVRPDLDVAANNVAVLLLDKRGDKASIERALNIARRFQHSKRPAYLDTLGWALLKNGQGSNGLPYLEKALAADEETPIFHFHAGMAYEAVGNKEKAKTHLLKALAQGVAFAGRDQAKAVVATF
ncbi:MAG: tetratricopeptide repeat protein, partial [Burkholderiales bacterium]